MGRHRRGARRPARRLGSGVSAERPTCTWRAVGGGRSGAEFDRETSRHLSNKRDAELSVNSEQVPAMRSPAVLWGKMGEHRRLGNTTQPNIKNVFIQPTEITECSQVALCHQITQILGQKSVGKFFFLLSGIRQMPLHKYRTII